MYNLNFQDILIYVSQQLPAWSLLRASAEWAAEFRKVQTRIMIQLLMELFLILL